MFRVYLHQHPAITTNYMPSVMKRTIFLVMLITILPIFSFGRSKDKQKKADHSTIFVIRPNEEMADEESIIANYYPGENGLKVTRKAKDNGNDWKWWEVRFDGCIAKGLGESDTNANYHFAGLYHYSSEFAFGAATGLYYSVGPVATNSVPVIALADYYFKSYMGFTPYLEAYGGYLIGFKNASMDCCAPNCGIFGLKAGISYNIYKTLNIRLAINYFNTTDNKSSKHENIAESCIGPCGSIGYRF